MSNEILDYAFSKKIMVDKKALSLLEKREDYKKIIDALQEKGLFTITEEDVEKEIIKNKIPLQVKEKTEKKEIETDRKNFRILANRDISENTTSEGKVDDFIAMFQDKYKKLRKILLTRLTGIAPRDIANIKKSFNTDVEAIVMVKDKHLSGSGNLILQVDDLTGTLSLIASKKNKELFERANQILLDNVIYVKVRKVKQFYFLQDFKYPGLIPRPKREGPDINILNITDLHIGSKKFLKKEFRKFIEWITGKTASKEDKKEIEKIKYLIITGDNIDGIGVYPDQYDDLEITDLYEQYEVFSDYILQIPDNIEIFICPGQHDAVRRAEPQPAIPKKYLPKLAEKKNIHLIGSPSWIEIEGYKILIYHGAALHALIEVDPELTNIQPAKAFAKILERRDIMSGFGIKNPYAPEKNDLMTIDIQPDIVYVGDFHHRDYVLYNNIPIINSGCWQEQTEFEAKIGHIPTPGFASIFNLKEWKLKYIKFKSD